jgi:lipopolysaccharide export system protein LptA
MLSRIFAAALVALLAATAPALAKPAAGGGGGGILPGAKASDPVKIDADRLDYLDKEQKLVYAGSVIVVNGPSTLKASKLTILLAKTEGTKPTDGAGSDKVRHVDGDGPITLVSPDQIATGDRMTFDRAENKVHLLGNVVWTQGETVIRGEHLVYDLATKQAQVLAGGSASGSGRVSSQFTPKSK